MIPVNADWNIQLGGAGWVDHLHFFFGGSNSSVQFQTSAIGFWRNAESGVLGLEGGLYSPFEGEVQYIKLGGVGQYFYGDMATIGAFGGALVPVDDFGGEVRTGFYAGGDLTYYAAHNIALAGFARYHQLGFNRGLVPQSKTIIWWLAARFVI